MRVVELCAGAGGMHLGLDRAGLRGIGLEREPAAVAVARAAGLDVRSTDVSQVASFDGLECDLLAGGVPCQAWSSAGKRRGEADPRNGWPWALAAIDRLRPRWCLFENVPGLLQHRGGCRPPGEDCPACYFATVLDALKQRFAVVEHRTLDAADYGVPQRRKRVLLVCGPAEIEWPLATHSQIALAWAKWRSGAYWREHGMAPVGEPSKEELRVLRGADGPGPLARWRTVRDALGLGLEMIGQARLPAGKGGNLPRPADDPAPAVGTGGTLYLRSGGAHTESRGRESPSSVERPSPTIPVCSSLYLHPVVRRLTVSECAALQGFPPDYPWHAAGTKTAAYRCVGNALPPAVADVMGRAILAADARKEAACPQPRRGSPRQMTLMEFLAQMRAA